jgi:hypothetical protein
MYMESFVALSIDVGTKNCGYCLIDLVSRRIMRWGLMSVSWTHADDLCGNLVRVLDAEAFPTTGIDRVIVERQPGRNKTMLRVEAYLSMYFASKGLRVTTYHAGNKLKDTGMENHGRTAGDYRLRKKASTELSVNFIEEDRQRHDPAALRNFERARKKDDMADALTQALSYGVPRATVSAPEDVRARKPTDNQVASGRYTKSNLKYLLERRAKETVFFCEDPARRLEGLVGSADAKIGKAFTRNYGTGFSRAIQELGLAKSLGIPGAPQSPPPEPST